MSVFELIESNPLEDNFWARVITWRAMFSNFYVVLFLTQSIFGETFLVVIFYTFLFPISRFISLD